MDERRALMAAIIANPDEDTPRLVFADWLQEHGDEHDQARAEFIRLQIAMMRAPVGAPDWPCQSAEATRLNQQHRSHWLAPLTAVPGTRLDSIVFNRGLVMYWNPREFTDSEFGLMRLADAFAHVGVEHIIVYNATTETVLRAASSVLRWVARFTWYGGDINGAGLNELATSPDVQHLSELTLYSPNLTDSDLLTFANTAMLPQLRGFGLVMANGSPYTATGVLAILASDRFPRLNKLNLVGSQPANFGFESLFAARELNRLLYLWLGNIPFHLLAACQYLSNLHALFVTGSIITDQDVDILLTNPAFANLCRLDLQDMEYDQPRLSSDAEKKLRERFGQAMTLEYASELV
ncbi:MAG: TIGR02996 domain-containing protein [Planctomycetes bacterium]|nr:TIGR02996 domain-containing protein [Planctomycetota bacterium]